MAVTLAASARTGLMTALRDTVADGTLEILSASNQCLPIFGLSSTVVTVSGDVWTLAFDAGGATTGTVASGTGTTATAARIKNTSAAALITGLTVGLTGSGADIKLDNVSISQGQSVTITSATMTYV